MSTDRLYTSLVQTTRQICSDQYYVYKSVSKTDKSRTLCQQSISYYSVFFIKLALKSQRIAASRYKILVPKSQYVLLFLVTVAMQRSAVVIMYRLLSSVCRDQLVCVVLRMLNRITSYLTILVGCLVDGCVAISMLRCKQDETPPVDTYHQCDADDDKAASRPGTSDRLRPLLHRQLAVLRRLCVFRAHSQQRGHGMTAYRRTKLTACVANDFPVN